ncbi:hypothetical protein CLV49_0932 [Labedella gwakjiensis]|uniref:Uncharacterized protein n=1 Tax=Labedella gwakjiensis TaxID=390269 RepID=A0A2P8GTQ1_9MICO|nr:hypothetical protein [Labedella gwakjiensis]PSL37325.1 hypothetical protein CLV49_0932 [Labedella gwakjiensis]RUQ84648.1 hypothetical protein ELQ93_13690 [Labedella gwakjiensis]
MATPSRRSRLWAIVFFVALGVAFIAYSSYRWATSDAADLESWSTGRGISLPGWGWIVLGYVCGLALLVFVAWATRWRRDRPSITSERPRE